VTGVLDSLERRGLVRRIRNEEDRRRVTVEITDEGLRVLAEVRAVVHRNEKTWMQALSDAELKRLIKLLQRVQTGLD